MKVGIVGTGFISEMFVDASKQTNIEIVAVYGRMLEKTMEFAKKYDIRRSYDDYCCFLECSQMDTVYIALPNSLHYEYSTKALKHAKNVIVEKSFCSNCIEFDKIVKVAEENNVFIIEMDRVLSLPNYKFIRENLNLIGSVRVIETNVCQYSRKYDAFLRGIIHPVFTTQFSGGALMDLGVYSVHAVVGLLGMPKKISYHAQLTSTGVDINGTLVMEYESAIATIVVGKNSYAKKFFIIQGENGCFVGNDNPCNITQLSLVSSSSVKDITVEQKLAVMSYTLEDIKRIIDVKDNEAYKERLQHSRNVMKVMDEARKKANVIFEADK